jgi:uncharacterized membrane protein YheB (UPF0754 family)
MISKLRAYHEAIKKRKREEKKQERIRKALERAEKKKAKDDKENATSVSHETGFVMDEGAYLPTPDEIRWAAAAIRAKNLDEYAQGKPKT